MKITAIYFQGVPPHPLFQKVLHIVTNTLQELEVTVDLIDLALWELPYYEGKSVDEMDQIIKKIRESQGVLLGSCISQGSIGGRMEVFLEHCNHSIYQEAFVNKPLLTVALSKDQGEREGAACLLRRWERVKGEEGEQILGSLPLLSPWEEEWTLFIERKTEDFYRILRQKRKSLPTSLVPTMPSTSFQQTLSSAIKEESISAPTSNPFTSIAIKEESISAPVPNPFMPTTIKEDLDHFTQQQQKDIEELTLLLKSQLAPPTSSTVPEPVSATAKQMTLSLPHYFQSHLVGDTQAIIHLYLQGEEPFESSILITEGHCTVKEGIEEKADVTLYVEEKVWKEILKGKISFQKAFMIGQMKVKGNFMLLSKLEQWFGKIL